MLSIFPKRYEIFYHVVLNNKTFKKITSLLHDKSTLIHRDETGVTAKLSHYRVHLVPGNDIHIFFQYCLHGGNASSKLQW